MLSLCRGKRKLFAPLPNLAQTWPPTRYPLRRTYPASGTDIRDQCGIHDGLDRRTAVLTAALVKLPQWLRAALLREWHDSRPGDNLIFKTLKEFDDFLLPDQVTPYF